MITPAIIRAIAAKVPVVRPMLSNRARWIVATAQDGGQAYKTFDEFLNRMTALIKSAYSGKISGGEFVDAVGALVSRQIFKAYNDAWNDEGDGTDGDPLPDYLRQSADQLIIDQFEFVDALSSDIRNAVINETPVDPFLARAGLWAQRFTQAYNQAVTLITEQNGGKLVWQLGATEEHCATCGELNGKVAFAKEWQEFDIKPQHAKNENLECQGWRCDCSLTPTESRRSRGIRGTLANIRDRKDGAR